MNAIIPIPKIDIAIRLATMDDFNAIDALQKKYNRALSFFPQEQFEGYIKKDGIRVAVQGQGARGEGQGNAGATRDADSSLAPCPSPLAPILGYVVSVDRYKHRDELGVIFQLCVAPGAHRKLVGAALVREVFEKSAYGTRLYCLWCAQDLDANHFWEAMGFVPLAFRAGSEKKKRLHIFWEKRIREGDTTTPWWFPSHTGGGAMRADRLVFPIPPGKRWSDELPIILPGDCGMGASPMLIEDKKKEHGRGARATRPARPLPPTTRRVQFGRPSAVVTNATPVVVNAAKPKRAKKPKQKFDPKYVAAARELRDRYLEHVNANPEALDAPAGKYHVVKLIDSRPAQPLLTQAA
jgi:ribosomal protein S18 acetylase RimI-like enzyme